MFNPRAAANRVVSRFASRLSSPLGVAEAGAATSPVRRRFLTSARLLAALVFVSLPLTMTAPRAETQSPPARTVATQRVATEASNISRPLWLKPKNVPQTWHLNAAEARTRFASPRGSFPVSNSPWTPKALSAGDDGLSHLLKYLDGRAATWTLSDLAPQPDWLSYGLHDSWQIDFAPAHDNRMRRLLGRAASHASPLWNLFAASVASTSPTYAPTTTPSPTATPYLTGTPYPTATPSVSPTPQRTGTPTATATPNPSPTPRPSPTPSPTYGPTQMPYPTATPYLTGTPYPTATPNASPTPQTTRTPMPTAPPQPTLRPTPTAAPVPTATPTPTAPPSATPTPRPTGASTPTPTPTYWPPSTPTNTPAPQATGTPVPTATPSASPTSTSAPQTTPAPTVAPAVIPAPTQIPEESWGKLRIFKDNNGELGEEIGASSSVSAAPQGGALPMSVSTNVEGAGGATVGGQIWLVLEVRVAPNELVRFPRGSIWGDREIASIGNEMSVREVWSYWDWIGSVFSLCGGTWRSGFETSTPERKIEAYRSVDRLLVDTRKLHNGTHEFGYYIPRNDPATGLSMVDGQGNTVHDPVNEIIFEVHEGPTYGGFYHSPYAGPILKTYTKPLKASTVNIQNLVITSAKASDGNKDYIRYDPESDDPQVANPTVSFSFKDGDYYADDRYNWQVILRETNFTGSGADTSIAQGVIDQLNDGQSTITVPLPESVQRGVYGFDVVVKKSGKWIFFSRATGNPVSTGWGLVDRQSLRSDVTFTSTFLDVEGEENNEQLKFFYQTYAPPSAFLHFASVICPITASPRRSFGRGCGIAPRSGDAGNLAIG